MKLNTLYNGMKKVLGKGFKQADFNNFMKNVDFSDIGKKHGDNFKFNKGQQTRNLVDKYKAGQTAKPTQPTKTMDLSGVHDPKYATAQEIKLQEQKRNQGWTDRRNDWEKMSNEWTSDRSRLEAEEINRRRNNGTSSGRARESASVFEGYDENQKLREIEAQKNGFESNSLNKQNELIDKRRTERRANAQKKLDESSNLGTNKDVIELDGNSYETDSNVMIDNEIEKKRIYNENRAAYEERNQWKIDEEYQQKLQTEEYRREAERIAKSGEIEEFYNDLHKRSSNTTQTRTQRAQAENDVKAQGSRFSQLDDEDIRILEARNRSNERVYNLEQKLSEAGDKMQNNPELAKAVEARSKAYDMRTSGEKLQEQIEFGEGRKKAQRYDREMTNAGMQGNGTSIPKHASADNKVVGSNAPKNIDKSNTGTKKGSAQANANADADNKFHEIAGTWGKTAVGAGLVFAMFNRGGQQTNAELYGQSTPYGGGY